MNFTLEHLPIQLPAPDLSKLDRGSLEAMRHAGEEVRECHRVLLKGGLNVSGEVLRGQGQFTKLLHYPKGDVYDRDSHSQYYYHAHREAEHGHFHTFMRAKGMAPDIVPIPEAEGRSWPSGDQALAHIVAISMDKHGMPIRLFTTNRWVTGETMYRAADVIRMIDTFSIDHANPSWPTNRWITGMLRLFRPQIEVLLGARDHVLFQRSAGSSIDIFEDRQLETISQIGISIEDQMFAVDRALSNIMATNTT